MKFRRKIPAPGARIIKSSAAVIICILLYYIRTLLPIGNGIPFYSALAALWCMQPDHKTTGNMALQRTVGTFIGAVYGLLFLTAISLPGKISQISVYIAAAVFIVPIIYTTVFINKKNASFFSCVVFLSIALTHSFDDDPFLFVLNRVLDTLIGIGVGVGVNTIQPVKAHNDNILYVSGIDSVLISDDPYSQPYSKVELNRLISSGVHFTVSTIHTPAELIPIMSGVDLKIPVIVMDGAAMYDTADNRFISAHFIDSEVCADAERLFVQKGIHCFVNVLYDNTVLVYYPELTNRAETDYYQKRRRSPYSNFIHSFYRNSVSTDRVLYLMGIDETEKINELEKCLDSTFGKSIRTAVSDSEYEGFSYIKVYSRYASKKEMIKEAVSYIKAEKAVTVGSIKGEYDIYIGDGGGNQTVKLLKKIIYTH